MISVLQDKTALIESVARRWARLGVFLNVPPADRTPELERLILDTARLAPANSRLFFLGATWLGEYGGCVDDQRLAQLISSELESEHRSVLGLMLELARGVACGDSRLEQSIRVCAPAIDARPLFDVENQNPLFAQLAERRASALSRRWGRWMAEFRPEPRALRPKRWISEQNPGLCGPDLAPA